MWGLNDWFFNKKGWQAVAVAIAIALLLGAGFSMLGSSNDVPVPVVESYVQPSPPPPPPKPEVRTADEAEVVEQKKRAKFHLYEFEHGSVPEEGEKSNIE